MRSTLFLIPLLLVGAVAAQQAPTAEDLVKKLGHDDYAVREQAMKQLIEMGDKAVPALEEAVKSDDLEVRLRAGRALRAIGGKARTEKPEAKREKAEEEPQPKERRRFHARPGAQSSSVQIEMRDGKVRVTVRETVDGKQTEETFEGASIEELVKKHPKLRDHLGGVRVGVGRDPFDMDKFWKDWNKEFDEDFVRRWQEESRRDMDRMRDWMRRLQEERGRRAPSWRDATDGNVLGVRARRPEAVLDAQLDLRGRGLVVDAVEKGTLAAHLGLARYDILLKLNGTEVRGFADVARALRGRKDGDAVTAVVLRRGKTLELKTAK